MEEIKNVMINLNKSTIEIRNDVRNEITEMREEFKKEMRELKRQNQEKEEKWNKEKRELAERIDKQKEWEYQYARRENKKRRAKGGILTGVRKTIETEKTKNLERTNNTKYI
uniref:Uncharacterized protein n=1 Tax=Photinus pyralis TaxID=7054 RepID=A0A1Y1LG44_PHOPY